MGSCIPAPVLCLQFFPNSDLLTCGALRVITYMCKQDVLFGLEISSGGKRCWVFCILVLNVKNGSAKKLQLISLSSYDCLVVYQIWLPFWFSLFFFKISYFVKIPYSLSG